MRVEGGEGDAGDEGGSFGLVRRDDLERGKEVGISLGVGFGLRVSVVRSGLGTRGSAVQSR